MYNINIYVEESEKLSLKKNCIRNNKERKKENGGK